MRLWQRLILGLVATAAWCAPFSVRTRADDKKNSADLFLRAAESTDIRSPGSSPFELDAKVNIWGFDGKPIPGEYKLVWISPSQWREEISFSGYRRLRVGGEEKYWQQRSLDYEPLQVKELTRAIDFDASLRGTKSPGRVKTRKESGVTVDCAQVGQPPISEYCFDSSAGVLVLVAEKSASAPVAPMPFTARYSNFQAFGTKQFPGTIAVEIERKPVADFSLIRLVGIAGAAAANIVPPEGAAVRLTCSNALEARLVNKVSPIYPTEEKRAFHEGVVVLYALIGEDGSVQNLKVLATPTQRLGEAALDAVRQWRYEPRRCGGTPTAIETFIDVAFSLSPP